jgi:hypothetical protein
MSVAAMLTAIAALKIKRARFVHVRDGIEIHQPGKPALLLTHEAARVFVQEIEEASQ